MDGDEHQPAQAPPAVPVPAVPEPTAPPPAASAPAEPPPTTPASEPAQEPAPPPEPSAAHRLKFYAKVVGLLFVGGYAIAFILDNDRTISVDFVFATSRVSLIWTILLLLAVGLVGGWLFSQLNRHRRNKKRRKA